MSAVKVIADQSGETTTMAVVVNGKFRFIEPKLDINEVIDTLVQGQNFSNDFFEVQETDANLLDLGARAVIIRCLTSGKHMVYPYSDFLQLVKESNK